MTNLKERTDELIVKSFSVCSCPLEVIKSFKAFCKEETRGYYWMGIKILLERNAMNFQQEVFAMKIQELESRLIALEGQEQEEKKPEVKTFGSRGKKDE